MTIDAFVFDFDGTLIDTETPQFDAARSIFVEHGVDLDVAWWAPIVGSTDIPDIVAELERRVGGSVDRRAVLDLFEERNRDGVANASTRPGVVALLDDAAAHGIPLAIASNAPRRWIEHHLTRVGLLDRFRIVVSLNDVRRGKPDPEPFATAAAALGADASRTMAFEDSAIGIASAVGAGLFTIAIPGALTGALHDYDEAHRKVETLEAVTVTRAREWLSA